MYTIQTYEDQRLLSLSSHRLNMSERNIGKLKPPNLGIMPPRDMNISRTGNTSFHSKKNSLINRDTPHSLEQHIVLDIPIVSDTDLNT